MLINTDTKKDLVEKVLVDVKNMKKVRFLSPSTAEKVEKSEKVGKKTEKIQVNLEKPEKLSLVESIKKTEKKAKELEKQTKYRKLVLAGGGLRGLAYVGAINALRKLGILDGIEEVVGCSIGSVFGLLIILDYSDVELHDFLLHFHYDQLKDLDFFKIMTEWGVESGSKIENFLIQLIKNKTGLDNPTFLELYKRVGLSLTVNAVALDDFNLYYFGVKESPDMKVVKAIRASISVPGLFTPVRYDNHLFVDGGLLNNFPIDYFKDKGVRVSSILGLNFDQTVKPPGINNLNGVNAYLSALMGCILNRIEKTGEADRRKQYFPGLSPSLSSGSSGALTLCPAPSTRTLSNAFKRELGCPKIIIIPTGNITAFQATLDRTNRLFLYHHGEQAVLNAFKTVEPDFSNVAFHLKDTELPVDPSESSEPSGIPNKLRRKSI